MLSFDPGQLLADFVPQIVAPLRSLASETIDAEAIVLGIALPGRIGERIASAYDERLFHGATLQDLPDEPRFVINATNVQSGVLWRFMKPAMRDYRVGAIENPTVRLADAVAASSAFPPVLVAIRAPRGSERFRSRIGPGPAAAPVHVEART
jgi:NTE family protein